MASPKKLKKLLKEDEEFVKFKRLVKRASEALDIEKDRSEALNLHTSRTARNLYGKAQFSAPKIADASARDLAGRSRLVEIRVRARVNLSIIEKAVKTIKGHIHANYKSALQDYRTKGEREAFIESVLGIYLEKLTEGEALLEMLDFLIKDIDQSGFALKNMTEVLKLMSETHGKVA
ncbi:hypothetical protein [Burkholderia phage BCSR5]|nr:hypothetical protein [Burkholderia phage BCSR5]